VKILIALAFLAGCHSSHHVECGVAIPANAGGIDGAPEGASIDVTVLDRGTNTIIELPSFTLDGATPGAICTDRDAGRCPGWQVFFTGDIASGKHTLSIGAVNYTAADVELEVKTHTSSGPCGSEEEIESISPTSVTVTLGP
jgi:hypothetical protein